MNNSHPSGDNRGKLHKFLLYGKSFLPFFLSHHPECENFRGHTINIGKYKLCIGCFIGYPIAFLGIIIIPLLNLHKLIPSQIFFIFGLIFIASFVLSPLNLTKIKSIKIIQKNLIGFGSSLLFWGIITSSNSVNTNLMISFFVLMILISLLNLYHAYGLLHTCYKCKTPFNWGECSGFKTIRDNFEKRNLNNFLLTLKNYSNSIKEKRDEKS